MKIQYDECPKVINNIQKIIHQGALSGTGRILILPIDHGFEHGPLASFGGNLEAMDPLYHFRFAEEVGVSALAAPLGFLSEGAHLYRDKVPLILKLNSNNLLADQSLRLSQAWVSSVDDAVRLGCVGVGVTVYPGAPEAHKMFENAAAAIARARSFGLMTVLWCYPRSADLKGREQAADVLAYAAHMGALLGAHIIKVKLPNQGIALKQHESLPLQLDTLQSQVALIMQAAFCGRRLVVFSGNNLDTREAVLAGARAIVDGGGHGSIIGRNIFQRPWSEAVNLVKEMIAIYKNG